MGGTTITGRSASDDSPIPVLERLDSGRYSLIHWFFCAPPPLETSLLRSTILPVVLTAGLTYGLTVLVAALTLPSLSERVPGVVEQPLLYDFNAPVTFVVLLPMMVLLIASERRTLTAAVLQVARNGVLRIPRGAAEELRTRWERTYARINLVSQAVGLLAMSLAMVGNYVLFTGEDFTSWQRSTSGLHAAGWVALFGIGLLWFVVSVLVFRVVALFFFTRSLVEAGEIRIQAYHPDRCGGLQSIGSLGLRTQGVIAFTGLNILIFIVTTYVFTDPGPVFPWFIATSVLAYAVFAPLAFLGPMIPFHTAMSLAKSGLLAALGRRIDATQARLLESLDSGAGDTNGFFETLQRLEKLGEWAHRMPVWPFDPSTRRKFLVAYIPPLVSLIASPAIASLVSVMVGSLGR